MDLIDSRTLYFILGLVDLKSILHFALTCKRMSMILDDEQFWNLICKKREFGDKEDLFTWKEHTKTIKQNMKSEFF